MKKIDYTEQVFSVEENIWEINQISYRSFRQNYQYNLLCDFLTASKNILLK